MKFITLLSAAATPLTIRALATTAAASRPLRVTVFGGTGYVGSAVCERLVKRGHKVTAVSRRGVNPKPESEELSKVNWVQGDATDSKVVDDLIKDSDAAVHAIGLLFDVESGLANLNKIVSGSGSIPGDKSTYDSITRATAFNVIDSIEKKQASNLNLQVDKVLSKTSETYRNKVSSRSSDKRFPLCFVSAAEAGWPSVPLGNVVDGLAPGWLKKYLTAKRAVEKRLRDSNIEKGVIRSVIFRPSLIWDWTKYDVLPAIPIFNVASAIGVPFVDKTVRIETLADAVVAGLENDDIEGVQRFMEMEDICERVR